MRFTFPHWAALVAMVSACSSLEPATTAAAIVGGPNPPTPALLPAVHLVEDDAGGDPVFTRPHIPPLRTTGDGRVAIELKKTNPTHVGFYLFAPEKLTSSWITSPAGVTVLADTAPYPVHRDVFYEGVYSPIANNLATTDHRTLCDAWPVANPRKNPYVCADDATLDCYDVTVISTYRHHQGMIQLHGKPIRIKVSRPKEPDATITDVVTDAATLGVSDAVAGPLIPGDFGLEPMVTADGHLLVMRLGDFPFTWEDGDGSARTVTDVFDIVYLVSDPDDLPCDVTQWTRWEPVTHAYGDEENAMAERYGFAKYALRDGKGALFVDGEDLGGSYPWIDRDGDNLFFTQLSSTVYYNDAGVLERRYADQCVPAAACILPAVPANLSDSIENDEQFRGFSFAGLWSRGKVIQLDNLANNTDYGLGRGEVEHRLLTLYSGPTTDVRVGTGRDNGGDDRPPGAVENTSFIDSWENLFNHDPEAHPTTVRDVVWILNTGKASVEVVFDDYLDVDGVIVSEMTGATSKAHPWPTTNQPTYFDGFVQTGPHRARYGGVPEVSNAATSLRWSVPASGIVENGGRIEPVALGGIVGKGLFLHGAGQALSYAMPAQQAVPEAWTIAMFIDPRVPDDGVARGLLSFPDGTEVALIGLSQLRYRRGAFTRLVSITAHPLVQGQWNHLAWVVRDGGHRADLYRDGYLFSSWTNVNQTLFGMFAAGTFRVGRVIGLDSMRAWIDEVKVFARDPGYEVVCNLGHGTLVRLDSNADPVWWPLSGRYNTHAALRTLLGTGANTRYVCLHDYGNPESPLLEHLPLDGTSVRTDLLFPEGPLHAAQPRPAGSDTNAFCLGCHTAVQPPELGLEALLYDPSILAQDDPRRQPMQTPPRIFGNVPMNYFTSGNPLLDAPADGLQVDPFVIP